MMTKKSKTIAVGLISGGLDSALAVKVLQKQNIEVTGLHFYMPWEESSSLMIQELSASLNIPIREIFLDEDYLSMLKNPRYGYGSAFNPCIDCHIYMFKKAGEFVQKKQADFVFTGEVLGQRPMSQNKMMLNVIEKRSGLEGLLVRPLSARLLEPTTPEKEGWLDREGLLSLSGRGRKEQIALAHEYGIKDYAQPAGGCLLTDKNFGLRMKDALSHGYTSLTDIKVLKLGRHFRLSDKVKVILGRDEQENVLLNQLANKDDYLMELDDKRGPTLLLKGKNPSNKDFAFSAGLVQYFSRQKKQVSIEIPYWKVGKKEDVFRVEALKLSAQEVERFLI